MARIEAELFDDHRRRLFSQLETYRPLGAERDERGIGRLILSTAAAVPRHVFVEEFRLIGDASVGPPRTAASSPEIVYSNRPLIYVDNAGNSLESSNSEPGFILSLLDRLDIQPGQRVLEIGCGTGWLAAVMGGLTGPQGSVVGIEIDPLLVRRGHTALRRLGVENVRLLAGDGFEEIARLGAFDRIILTASLFDLPRSVRNALAPGGLMVAPFRSRGPGEEALVLRRADSLTSRLRSEESFFCKFVKMRGALQADNAQPFKKVSELRLLSSVSHDLSGTEAFHCGVDDTQLIPKIMNSFSVFMTKAEDNAHVVLEPYSYNLFDFNHILFGPPESYALAIEDAETGSAAVWQKNELRSYAGSAAGERFRSLFSAWNALGRPSIKDASVTVSDADGEACDVQDEEQGILAEPRGQSLFVWNYRKKS